MKYWVSVKLERFFRWLAAWAGEIERCCALCPDCGRNRYTGAPCKNL